MCTIKEQNRIVLGFWKPLEIVLASANLAEKFAKILILAAVTTSLFRHADNGHILGLSYDGIPRCTTYHPIIRSDNIFRQSN